MAELLEICSKFFGNNKTGCSNVLMAFQQRTTRMNGGMGSGSMKIGQHTQFVNFILNSGDFMDHFDAEFNKASGTVFPHQDPTRAREVHGGEYLKTRVTKQQRFTREDLVEYLKASEYFHEYYTNALKEVHRFYFNDDLDPLELDRLLKKVRHEFDFTNEKSTANDVDEYLHRLVREEHNDGDDALERGVAVERLDDRPFQAMFRMRFDRLPTMGEIREYNDFMSDHAKVVTMYFQTRYKRYNVFAQKVCEAFFAVFGRDITSFELIKYYDAFSKAADDAETDALIRRYHANFTTKYNKVVSIFKDYLNSPVDYFEFVKRYIEYMEENDTDYDDLIIDMVVGYDRYMLVMRDQIRTVYKTTFDRDITEHDMDYFYERAYKDRLSIVCESLPVIVTSLKTQTDTYVATVHEIMQRVLRRAADPEEEVYYVDYFRDQTTSLKPEIRMEDELYESLEYHDVLKSMIAERFSDERKNNKPPGRSELFKMLTHVLNVPDRMLKRDPDAVIAELKRHF